MQTLEVTLPTLHPGQVEAWRLPGKRKAIRCGRRWGKTGLLTTVACDAATKGQSVGWFAPEYKFQAEAFNDVHDVLEPIKKRSSRTEGVIRTITGGRVDFWSLENEHAGRSRKYHIAIIDEAAFTKPGAVAVWERAIEPTLLDYQGTAWMASNTNGIDAENMFWLVCNESKYRFLEYHAPFDQNPYVPLRRPGEPKVDYILRREAEFAEIKKTRHPLVYRQEYLAEFVDWSGDAFFSENNLLNPPLIAGGRGLPLEIPSRCDYVFAMIDTATKTGNDRDGTGVVIFARTRYGGIPLIVLDYDIVQIEGDLLSAWLPSIFQKLEEWSRRCGAIAGWQQPGVFIEDKNSGSILLQQASRKGWPAHPIESKLTALGKQERAINASSYVYQGLVKFARPAFEKVKIYKDVSRNHLWTQIMNFRPGIKDQGEDDLLDCFTYGVATALGNQEGF